MVQNLFLASYGFAVVDWRCFRRFCTRARVQCGSPPYGAAQAERRPYSPQCVDVVGGQPRTVKPQGRDTQTAPALKTPGIRREIITQFPVTTGWRVVSLNFYVTLSAQCLSTALPRPPAAITCHAKKRK